MPKHWNHHIAAYLKLQNTSIKCPLIHYFGPKNILFHVNNKINNNPQRFSSGNGGTVCNELISSNHRLKNTYIHRKFTVKEEVEKQTLAGDLTLERGNQTQ